VSLNLAVTQPTANGHLRLYPGGSAPPLSSALNYVAGATRANNAITVLGPAGDLGVSCRQASGTAHVIVDVNGYFAEEIAARPQTLPASHDQEAGTEIVPPRTEEKPPPGACSPDQRGRRAGNAGPSRAQPCPRRFLARQQP
jgi:hypothetical protein